MTGVNDPQRYGRKFQNQLEKVREADISEADREAILDYVRHLDASGSVNKGTIVSKMNRLRLTSERADVDLVDMDLDSIETFLFEMKHERDYAESTLRNYRKALRTFFKYRDEDWAEDLKIGPSPTKKVDPNSLLTMDDIKDLISSARNPRDKALIAMMADTGLRIGAVASLRIRDLDFQGNVALVGINEEANVKGASGQTPLTWSEGYVSNWLESHPRRDEPDAPLFHVREGWYDSDEEGDGSLDYQYLSRRVRNVADKADISREKVNTHNFRKSAISRWIREGMSEQAIKHRAHWDVDTDMFATYSGVRDEELNEQILDHYGYETDSEAARPQLEHCPRCGASLHGGEQFCPRCAGPLTDRAVARSDDIEDKVFESLPEADEGAVEFLREFRDRFKDDTQFRELVTQLTD